MITKMPGADDAADAQAGQGPGAEHPPEAVLALHLLVHQAERLSLEQMPHRSPINLRSMTYDLLLGPDIATGQIVIRKW